MGCRNLQYGHKIKKTREYTSLNKLNDIEMYWGHGLQCAELSLYWWNKAAELSELWKTEKPPQWKHLDLILLIKTRPPARAKLRVPSASRKLRLLHPTNIIYSSEMSAKYEKRDTTQVYNGSFDLWFYDTFGIYVDKEASALTVVQVHY